MLVARASDSLLTILVAKASQWNLPRDARIGMPASGLRFWSYSQTGAEDLFCDLPTVRPLKVNGSPSIKINARSATFTFFLSGRRRPYILR
jgi:hypothetical protein